MYRIRPFQEEDRAAIVAIENRDRPAYRLLTVEDWRADDLKVLQGATYLSLVAGDPAIAFMEVTDRSTTALPRPGVCQLELIVAHEERGKGIGSALYERAEAFVKAQKAHTFEVWFYQYRPDEPAIPFLQKRGFEEIGRRQTSQRDLTTFQIRDYIPLLNELERQGARVILYGVDVPDNDQQRRKLYEMLHYIERLPEHSSYETWVKAEMEHANWKKECLAVAEVDGRWVGITSAVVFNQNAKVVRIPFTGVHAAYRQRGIATALKARTMEVMKQRGYHLLLTSNLMDNVPILAANRKLGFTPGAIELTYRKSF